jgi:hypothetical protein
VSLFFIFICYHILFLLDIKKLAPSSSGRLQLLAPQLSGHILKFVSRLFGTLHKLAPDFQVNPLTLSPLSFFVCDIIDDIRHYDDLNCQKILVGRIIYFQSIA